MSNSVLHRQLKVSNVAAIDLVYIPSKGIREATVENSRNIQGRRQVFIHIYGLTRVLLLERPMWSTAVHTIIIAFNSGMHLRLPHSTRMKIAAQLQQGVTIERILDNIRDNTPHGITREHLLTKSDIKNQYNIEGITRHTNDLTSVCAWGFKTQTYNSIPFKPQGNPSPISMSTVGLNDFILCIQTEFFPT